MKNFFLVNFIFLLVLGSSLVWPNQSLAQVKPFGGKIISTVWCTCSGNMLIFYRPVLGSMPKLLSFRPIGSKLYSYYNLSSGMEILGTTSIPDTCMMAGSPCYPHPLVVAMGLPWLISIVGTSDWGHQAGSGSAPLSETTSPGSGGEPTTNSGTQPTTSSQPCVGEANRLASSYIIANEGWINSCQNDYCTDGQIRKVIGVGHNITGSEWINCSIPLSDKEVQTLYDKDYKKYRGQAEVSATNHGVNWQALSPERQAVLTDMAFNMGAEGGGGLDGFDKMWGNIKQAQLTGQQPYWDKAGDEIMNSRGYGQVTTLKPRAGRNASVMRTNDKDLLDDKIKSDPHAKANCTGSKPLFSQPTNTQPGII